MSNAVASDDALGRETIRRVSWRILPFLMLAYLDPLPHRGGGLFHAG